MALLQVHHLEVHYGPIRALMGIDLEVREGEIVALVGANGAGKTSTMHAICGIVPLVVGRIEYAGQRLDRLPAHRIMTRGIAHVPEGRQIFTHMTLRDNLLLGATHRSQKSRPEKDIDRVMAQFPLLQHRLSERAFNLSGGELQMLALARGLMARPKLFLLDEPSLGLASLALGLASLAVDEVFRLIDALRSQGITILLVEQNIRRALMIANRGYVLESGRIILSGAASKLLHDDLVKRAYLGDTHHD